MSFESKFRNVVGRIESLEKQEIRIILRELLRELNEEKRITLKGWKGKSSFEYYREGEEMVVTKYQKPEKGEEPKKINYRISIKEIIEIETMIKYSFKHMNLNSKDGKKYIESRDIAEKFYNNSWKNIFNNRKTHNRFTIILNILDKKGIIEYKGGKIYTCYTL